jgi:hypothetical protein
LTDVTPVSGATGEDERECFVAAARSAYRGLSGLCTHWRVGLRKSREVKGTAGYTHVKAGRGVAYVVWFGCHHVWLTTGSICPPLMA